MSDAIPSREMTLQEKKQQLLVRMQTVKSEVLTVQRDLKYLVPNADGLVVMRDLEKAQRQAEKILSTLQGLVV